MSSIRRSAAAFLLSALAPFAAVAQEGDPPPAAEAQAEGLTKEQQGYLSQAIHHVMVAQADLAASNLEALITSGEGDSDFATKLARSADTPAMSDRVERMLSRGAKMEKVGPLVAQLGQTLHDGRLQLARERTRIRSAIKMLTNARQWMAAQALLEAAGEYAVPDLLDELTHTQDSQMRLALQRAMTALGTAATLPLAESLDGLAVHDHAFVCEILAQTRDDRAEPFLLEIAESDGTGSAIAAQVAAIVGKGAPTARDAFIALAERYLLHHPATDPGLVARAGEASQNLWSYDPRGGLIATQVATAVYTETMARDLALRAMRMGVAQHADETFLRHALAVFITASFGLEAGGASAEGGPSAEYLATAAGPEVASAVLHLALEAGDKAAARGAIRAIGDTARQGILVPAALTSEGSALAAALASTDPGTRLEAAVAIASMRPRATSSATRLVVPTLAEVVRSNGRMRIAVLASSAEGAAAAKSAAGDAFEIIAEASGYEGIEPAIAQRSGVDAVAVSVAVDEILPAVGAIRGGRTGAAAPIVVLVAEGDVERARHAVAALADRWLAVAAAGVAGEEFLAALRAAGGPPESEQAAARVERAVEALELIGQADYEALEVSRGLDRPAPAEDGMDLTSGESQLLEAFGAPEGGRALQVAATLAWIGTPRSQQALAAAAIESARGGGPSAPDMLDLLRDDIARFGNMLTSAQIEEVQELLPLASDGDLAKAVSRLYGTLGLPADAAVGVVIGK